MTTFGFEFRNLGIYSLIIDNNSNIRWYLFKKRKSLLDDVMLINV